MDSRILMHVPFYSLRDKGKDGTELVDKKWSQGPLWSMVKFILAPFIGLIYIMVLPVAVIGVVFAVLFRGMYHLVMNGVLFGTRPSRSTQ